MPLSEVLNTLSPQPNIPDYSHDETTPDAGSPTETVDKVHLLLKKLVPAAGQLRDILEQADLSFIEQLRWPQIALFITAGATIDIDDLDSDSDEDVNSEGEEEDDSSTTKAREEDEDFEDNAEEAEPEPGSEQVWDAHAMMEEVHERWPQTVESLSVPLLQRIYQQLKESRLSVVADELKPLLNSARQLNMNGIAADVLQILTTIRETRRDLLPPPKSDTSIDNINEMSGHEASVLTEALRQVFTDIKASEARLCG